MMFPEVSAEAVRRSLSRPGTSSAPAAESTWATRIKQILREMSERIRPAYACVLLDAGPDLFEDISLPADVSAAPQVILMAVTLGAEADRLIRVAQINALDRAVILDSCAALAVQESVRLIRQAVFAELATAGRYPGRFYAPGDEGVPLTLQPRLCRLLDTRRKIGLSVDPRTCLLQPLKSLTMLAGVSKEPRPRPSDHDCRNCPRRAVCTYKKE
jgi:hypothetical protein